MRSTAEDCPGESRIGSVFGDPPTEKLDGLGDETGLGVVAAGEIAHSVGCEEFARDAGGFSVVVMGQNGSNSMRLRLKSGRR